MLFSLRSTWKQNRSYNLHFSYWLQSQKVMRVSIACLAFLMNAVALYTFAEDNGITNRKRGNKILACYFGDTSIFPASMVPGDLCTHIIYVSGIVTPNGIAPSKQSDVERYKTLVRLKINNPELKVMITLQSGFQHVVSENTTLLKSFATGATQFLHLHGFDGVDLDWEFPSAFQKGPYQLFIQILSSELKKSSLLLSAALPNNPFLYKRGYDASCLSKYMDFMTAMTYDFHLFIAAGDNITGYNSPTYTPLGETAFFSTNGMLQIYIDSGIPASKLLMGVPIYGRSWKLQTSAVHGLHSPAVDKGDPGPFAHVKGVYLYADVCLAKEQGANVVRDEDNGATYMFRNNTWVAFDDYFTIDAKMMLLAKKNLAGVGIWQLAIDDTRSVCKKGFLPLTHYLKYSLEAMKDK